MSSRSNVRYGLAFLGRCQDASPGMHEERSSAMASRISAMRPRPRPGNSCRDGTRRDCRSFSLVTEEATVSSAQATFDHGLTRAEENHHASGTPPTAASCVWISVRRSLARKRFPGRNSSKYSTRRSWPFSIRTRLIARFCFLNRSGRQSQGQYHRPRPYQPPPPISNTIRMIIRSVVISIGVLQPP